MLFTGSNTYTGATTVSGGGTLQLGDGAVNNGSVAGNVALVNNSAVIFANPSSQTYAGVISGTGSLTKNGEGTLYLSGNHTYSGPTVINTGMVQLNQLSAVSGFGANTVSGTAGGAQTTATVSTNNGTWTLNTYGGYGTGLLNTPVTGGSLDLTDGTGADSGFGYKAARTAFFNSPVPVNTSFKATFTYTASDPGGADGSTYGANYDNGFAFVIQNSGTGGAERGRPRDGFREQPQRPSPTQLVMKPPRQSSTAPQSLTTSSRTMAIRILASLTSPPRSSAQGPATTSMAAQAAVLKTPPETLLHHSPCSAGAVTVTLELISIFRATRSI